MEWKHKQIYLHFDHLPILFFNNFQFILFIPDRGFPMLFSLSRRKVLFYNGEVGLGLNLNCLKKNPTYKVWVWVVIVLKVKHYPRHLFSGFPFIVEGRWLCFKITYTGLLTSLLEGSDIMLHRRLTIFRFDGFRETWEDSGWVFLTDHNYN